MISEATREAARAGTTNVSWVVMRAEQLPGGLGGFRLVTLAQSFHWMNQRVVADAVHRMLDTGGAVVHIGGMTHRGVVAADSRRLGLPSPPYSEIDELTVHYLGPVRRAGRDTLPRGTRSGEDAVLLKSGFDEPRRVVVTGGQIVERSLDEVVASTFSLSSSAPHLFGDRVTEYEQRLRSLLAQASPTGRFQEQTGDIAVSIWKPGPDS